MKIFILILTIFLINSTISGQVANPYKSGLTAEQNLMAIGKLSPNSSGAVGFDDRYQGVKGSRMLNDTLLPSYVRVRGQNFYIQIETDLDIVGNMLLYKNPKTGKLYLLPSANVAEVIIQYHGKEHIYKTIDGRNLEKSFKDYKFSQVLRDGKYQFIKVPEKDFIEADFKGAYSSDRRYDEYKNIYRYYIAGSDSSFHQINLTKKALIRLFPEKKELISGSPDLDSYTDKEAMVLAILEKF
jgi:hypothetical protein